MVCYHSYFGADGCCLPKNQPHHFNGQFGRGGEVPVIAVVHITTHNNKRHRPPPLPPDNDDDNNDDRGGVGGLLVMRKQKVSDSPSARMQRGGGPGTLDGGTLFLPPPSRSRRC